MKSDCTKWRDQLLEAALAGTAEGKLAQHVAKCRECSAALEELRARRERLEVLLPLMARAEPSAEFRARVLNAAEASLSAKREMTGRVWGFAAVAIVSGAALLIGLALNRKAGQLPAAELTAAEKLAEWRAPTDVLLNTPGQELLRTAPKLDDSYLPASATKHEEE